MLKLVYMGDIYLDALMHKQKRYKKPPTFALGSRYNDCLCGSLLLNSIYRIFKESSSWMNYPAYGSCIRNKNAITDMLSYGASENNISFLKRTSVHIKPLFYCFQIPFKVRSEN